MFTLNDVTITLENDEFEEALRVVVHLTSDQMKSVKKFVDARYDERVREICKMDPMLRRFAAVDCIQEPGMVLTRFGSHRICLDEDARTLSLEVPYSPEGEDRLDGCHEHWFEPRPTLWLDAIAPLKSILANV